MSDEVKSFVARVLKSGKVTIPVEIREALGIGEKDLVDMTIRKVEKVSLKEG